MEEKRITPVKAIRLKCLDCCCGSSNEVKLCTVESCALYPFRLGKNPNYAPKEFTPAQREAQKAAPARLHQRILCEKTANSPSEGTYTPRHVSGEIPANRTEEKA